MPLNIFISVIIIICGLMFCIGFATRNEWVLTAKLKVFEKAIKKRHSLEREGKKGKLLREIEQGMWSYNKMLYRFWEKDITKMFTDDEIKQYLFEKEDNE